jgi:hypothetical protein
MSYSPGYGAAGLQSPKGAFGASGSSALTSPRFSRAAGRSTPTALGSPSALYASAAGRLDRQSVASAPSPNLARQRAVLAQDVASLSADLEKLQRGAASRDSDSAARASVSQALLHREAAQVVALEHQLSQAEQHKEAALQNYSHEIDSLRSSMNQAACVTPRTRVLCQSIDVPYTASTASILQARVALYF